MVIPLPCSSSTEGKSEVYDSYTLRGENKKIILKKK